MAQKKKYEPLHQMTRYAIHGEERPNTSMYEWLVLIAIGIAVLVS